MATWTIANLEYNNDADKGVIVAHYVVTETDAETELTASSYGTVGFTPDASADGYVAFDSLTEADVIGWVKDALDADAIEAALADNIAEQKAPATATGLPWAAAE